MVTATISAAPPQTQQPPATTLASRLLTALAAPSLFAALCFSSGTLLAYFHWFLPGLFLLALLAAFAIAAIAATRAPRLAWIATALVYLLLGVFCAEVAPAVNPQQELARLANNTRRNLQGRVVRIGAVRTITSTLPFSNQPRIEHSQRFELRIPHTGTARITVYAPVTAPFPHLACNDVIRVDASLHQMELFLDPGV